MKERLVVGLLVGASFTTFACASGESPQVGSAGRTSPGDSPSSAETTRTAQVSPGEGDGGAYTDRYNFTATTFEGDTFRLAVHKGTPVVINFWESW